MKFVLRLLGVGALPLALGALLNFIMPFLSIPGYVLAILLLAAWGFMAFKLTNPAHNSGLQALSLCTFGLFVLLLALYQEFTIGGYWQNWIGAATQIFFLPWLPLGYSIATSIFPLTGPIKLWPIYTAAWVILFIASWIGCAVKSQTQRSKSSDK
ncbi:MAG: hypothetical protein NC081_05400 [Roseburia sp.]|nr:hypothetical protein [Lachnospiraceae bacterium]MCM1568868.1 hypothetical protein [Roseburia sp.]